MKNTGLKEWIFYAFLLTLIAVLLWPRETGSLFSKAFFYVKDFVGSVNYDSEENGEELEQKQDA